MLHVFPDGLLRSEGAWLFYVLFKLGLSMKDVNTAIQEYSNFPNDVRVPKIHGKLKQGTRKGQPKSGMVLKMTGSQCTHFAMHRCATLFAHTLPNYLTPLILRLRLLSQHSLAQAAFV